MTVFKHGIKGLRLCCKSRREEVRKRNEVVIELRKHFSS